MRQHQKKKAGVSVADGVTPQPVADAALLANPRGMVLLKSAVFFFSPNASADTCVMILLACVSSYY
jgi:hypothetical protein